MLESCHSLFGFNSLVAHTHTYFHFYTHTQHINDFDYYLNPDDFKSFEVSKAETFIFLFFSHQRACCWFSVLTLVSLLSLCWMYVCLVTFNDQDDVNCFILSQRLRRHICMSCYKMNLLSLQIFALFQVLLGEPLDLHWLHKVLLFLGVIFIAFGVAGISLKWQQEWPTVPLSLQATAPFLQFGAVGALTLLSPFVFRGSKFLIAVVFVTVSTAIFLCPLYIQSPCLIEMHKLPEKPKLIGHRGAPMLAPENTMMSFNSSVTCGVTAFETDVQLSEDRVPFLMHDHKAEFLRRTTNVKDKFPDKYFSHSSNFTWEELKSLNAGEWFIKVRPGVKRKARRQTIPSLLQLLNLAKQHNVSVVFDLYSPDVENDTEDIVSTILSSGIDQSLILWLPPEKRDYVDKIAPGFIQVYKNTKDMLNKTGNHLNVKYSTLSMKQISDLRSMNITVNLWVVNERWLFSLLWCAGASSVTTNSCHLLKKMNEPDWVMAHDTYKVIWISVDVVSFVIMIGLYIFQR
uniref:Glycerophosphodiester phosphodiesterase domain containing 2 n=1 Tax=Labrus bergylta TaxID=56723 RepID=A0A3Q3EXS4_9LABR